MNITIRVSPKPGIDTYHGPNRHSPACVCPNCMDEPADMKVELSDLDVAECLDWSPDPDKEYDFSEMLDWGSELNARLSSRNREVPCPDQTVRERGRNVRSRRRKDV